MTIKRFLTKPTLGIVFETGCAIIVPPGQIVEIAILPPEGNRTVDVTWDGKPLMMFVNDLQNRSREIGV